jgi:hypothetical protein
MYHIYFAVLEAYVYIQKQLFFLSNQRLMQACQICIALKRVRFHNFELTQNRAKIKIFSRTALPESFRNVKINWEAFLVVQNRIL